MCIMSLVEPVCEIYCILSSHNEALDTIRSIVIIKKDTTSAKALFELNYLWQYLSHTSTAL